VVVRTGTHAGRGPEAPLARCRLLHEVAPDQLAQQRLENHVRGKYRLTPVVLDRGQRLGDPAGALPGRVGVPCLDVRRAVESFDLLAQGEVVQREVLREADLVHAVHGNRRVVHVRWTGPV